MKIVITHASGEGDYHCVSPEMSQEEANKEGEVIKSALMANEIVHLSWGSFRPDHIVNFRVVEAWNDRPQDS